MKSIILASVSIVLFTFTSTSPTAYPSAKPSQKIEKTEDIEIIEVYGKKPLSTLRAEVYENQRIMIKLFNSLVEDDDLKYFCHKRQIDQSRLKYKVCESAYETRIKQGLLTEGLFQGTNNDLASLSQAQQFALLGSQELELKKAEQLKLMIELTNNNPKFHQVMTTLINSKKAYIASHERAFGKYSTLARRVTKGE